MGYDEIKMTCEQGRIEGAGAARVLHCGAGELRLSQGRLFSGVGHNPSGIDAKGGDHFLQADFPVLISSMSGLAIYHSSRRS